MTLGFLEIEDTILSNHCPLPINSSMAFLILVFYRNQSSKNTLFWGWEYETDILMDSKNVI